MKGFGPAALAKLNFESILDLFTFSESYFIDTLGDTVGKKLFAETRKALSQVTLDQVIAGLGVPLVGSTAATKLVSVVKTFEDINLGACKAAGLGEKVTSNLLEYIQSEEYHTLKELLSRFKPTENSTKSNSLKVCITGKLNDFKSRSQAAQYLETLGFTVVDSVTKATDILINEEDRDSSKLTKAKSLGIMITTIKELEKDIK